MQAAVLYRPHDLRIEERPDPTTPPPGHALVAVTHVGLCGSDVHYYEHGRIADFVLRAPMILGHEAAGRVVALGQGVTGPAVGTTVAIEPGIPCGRCPSCLSGRYNLCPDVRFLATPPIDGALVHHLVHPAHLLFDAGDLPASRAWMAEPASVAVHALRRARVELGQRVAVFGAGAVGLFTAMAAEAAGARVWLYDVDGRRVEGAKTLGIRAALFPPEADTRVDIAFDCSGAGPAIHLLPEIVRPGGTVVLVGLGTPEAMAVDGLAVAARELTVMGVMRYANTYPAALALLTRFRERIDRLPLTTIGMNDLPVHLAEARYRNSVKTMVEVV